MTATSRPWWQGAVLYQIYPRSFVDSDGDGHGDLGGVVAGLDHLAWLGVDALWLCPVTPSPNADWGYDVADYTAVDPQMGTLAEFDGLVAEAGRRGMRVVVDFVPNHTSDRHRWFVDACSSRAAAHRDWYVWADPKPDGSPPNNWVSSCGGPAWTFEAGTGQYYLHNHLAEQPDLNWWNDEVRRAFDEILEFWWGHGVAGFRIDVCNLIVKDAQLRDNPPATGADSPTEQLFGQRQVYNANRPEVHDVVRHWRRLADRHPDSLLLGETPVEDVGGLMAYYGNGDDELHLAMNFPFIDAPLDAAAMRSVVEDTEAALPDGAWPVWAGSNHDMSRFATRWADGRPERAAVALFVLLGLRGTAVLYQGDEIGLPDVPVPPDRLRDPLGVRYWPAYAGRDAMRTPMHWHAGPGGGFTTSTDPWLPLGDTAACNVEDQRADPDSLLHLTRRLLTARRSTTDLRTGAYRSLTTGPGTWAWRRGEGIVVVTRMADGEDRVKGVEGRILVASRRDREGRTFDDHATVEGWEALVIDTTA